MGDSPPESRQAQTDEQCKTIIDGFEILERIGGGAFSRVHIARHILTGTYVAAKIVNLASLKEEEFPGIMREISVFMQVEHSRICSLYRLSLHENELIFFIEYAPNGTLLNYVNARRGIPENEAKRLFIQLFDAIRYLHITHFCVHRDLKLENVLLDANNNVKVTDFGLASKYYNNQMRTLVGTPGYQAPEVLAGGEYDEKCDVWSLGVCLWAMLTAGLPFSPQSGNFHDLIEEAQNLAYPSGFSPALTDFLKKMFQVRPASRPNLVQLQNHPWLRPMPQLSANVAPSPIVFYKISSVCQICRFKRRTEAVNSTLINGTKEKMNLDDAGVEKLESELKEGLTSEATTSYFCLKWPLLEKPVPPDWKAIFAAKRKELRAANTPSKDALVKISGSPAKPPVIPGATQRTAGRANPNVRKARTGSVAMTSAILHKERSSSTRTSGRSVSNPCLANTMKSPIIRPLPASPLKGFAHRK